MLPVLAFSLGLVLPATGIHVVARVEPFVDLWFDVRELGSKPAGADVPEPLREAVAAARALDEQLGSPLAWGPVEGLLADCRSAADLLAALGSVPETLEPRPGQSVKLREGARTLVEALAKAEESLRKGSWPEREARIRQAVGDDYRVAFGGNFSQCLAQQAAAVGAEGLDLVVPCFFVASAPAPGAITHRGQDGKGVCFVSVAAGDGSLLAEIVLHEATHAIDLARDGDAFDDLRARLVAAGFGPRDRELRDAPHTLMFLQSAHTIRRCFALDHKDYGDVAGYYAKVQRVVDIEKPAWSEYLAGKIARADALDRIVTALKPAPPGK